MLGETAGGCCLESDACLSWQLFGEEVSISTDCKTSLRADNPVRGDLDDQCMAFTTGDQNQAGIVAMQAAALFRSHLGVIPQQVQCYQSYAVRHPSYCRRRHTIATGLRILLFHRGVQHDEQENRDSTHPQSAYFLPSKLQRDHVQLPVGK